MQKDSYHNDLVTSGRQPYLPSALKDAFWESVCDIFTVKIAIFNIIKQISGYLILNDLK